MILHRLNRGTAHRGKQLDTMPNVACHHELKHVIFRFQALHELKHVIFRFQALHEDSEGMTRSMLD
jgi:hypothetical protein